MPPEMKFSHLYSPQSDDDDIATLEKDLFLNMLVVVLLLVGGPSFLTRADPAKETAQTALREAIHVFIEDDGDLHLGSLASAHVALETLPHTVQNVIGAAPSQVLIHHTATTPAGLVHAVLRALEQVPRATPLLALSDSSTLICEKQEGQP